MANPIFDPDYWAQRLKEAQTLHHAVYVCDPQTWRDVWEFARKILLKEVKDTDSVIDVGCAWGQLLEVMPQSWYGDYTGIDLSHDFINLAREKHPQRMFWQADARDLSLIWERRQFDLAIVGSIRGMVIREIGEVEWEKIEHQLSKVAKRTLILEYGDRLGHEHRNNLGQ